MPVSTTSEAYTIQRNLLTLTGIWPKKNPDRVYKIKTLTSWCFAFGLYTILLIQFMYNITDIFKLSRTLYILIAYVEYITKLIAFTYYKTKFLNLLEYLKDPIFASYPEDLDHHMAKTIRQLVLLTKFVCCAVISNTILFGIYPILDNAPLPFALPYGFERYTTVVYVLQMIGESCNSLNHAALDLVCTCLMGVVATHLNILGKKIIRFNGGHIRMQNYLVLKKAKGNDIKTLEECVEHHLAIIRAIDYIEDIFNVGILSQLATSILVLCTTLFIFVLLPVSSQQIALGDYLILMLMQLFMYCWYGHKIVEKSLQIGEACYMSKWYESDCRTRKYLFLIMERAKKPLKLTALKISVLSLSSFTTILEWSYSFFTLLLNMYSRKSEKTE